MNLPTRKRIESIDLLRGIVIVIMALDHTRDYFHAANFLFDPNDLTRASPAIFFTRWITNFCAPTFVFLAGTSAFLVGQRKSKADLARFLLTRGLWLMFLEITVVSFAWSFNPAFPIFRLQVIWALGVCMVILAGVIWLPKPVILAIGLALIFGHNLLDGIRSTGNSLSDFIWCELHQRRRFLFHGHTITTGYCILPWFGVMALGYCFGQFYRTGFDAPRRKKYLLGIGGGAIGLFIILRGLNGYGDMEPWSRLSTPLLTLCSFLNVTKYPPSLLYCLSTLGPALLFLAFSEKPLGWFGSRVIHFGRVPMFFYLLHIYLIHFGALIAVVAAGRPWTQMQMTLLASAKDSPWLAGYGFSLIGTYGVWIAVVLILYPLCVWYDRYKSTHKDKKWLSYL